MLSEEILTPVDLSLNTGKSRDGEEDWVSVMTTFLLISSKILLPLSHLVLKSIGKWKVSQRREETVAGRMMSIEEGYLAVAQMFNEPSHHTMFEAMQLLLLLLLSSCCLACLAIKGFHWFNT